MIDLHVHSNCSDGSFTPRELVEYALNHDITAFALTDHDTVAGLDEAIACARELSGKVCEQNPEGKTVEVVPGIEFSTEYEGRDVHIVGLFIDYKSEVFRKHISDFVASRENRNEKMCALLREHGVDITYEQLKAAFPGAVITRAHYARFLLENGYVKSMNEAFDRYVGDHAPCFIPREKVTPLQAVDLILAAGGVPVLAHPVLYGMSSARLEKLVSVLTDAGLVALEAIYSSYTNADTQGMQTLARRYGLLISGGSDFHGSNKPGLSFGTGYGSLYLHESILEALRNAAGK
ncbi:MAG: PHP domain-containing protein [Lachnospiraceae bacterium]|nr:PHP domain-containing protein [Lachnospiraceae bacterium]